MTNTKVETSVTLTLGELCEFTLPNSDTVKVMCNDSACIGMLVTTKGAFRSITESVSKLSQYPTVKGGTPAYYINILRNNTRRGTYVNVARGDNLAITAYVTKTKIIIEFLSNVEPE